MFEQWKSREWIVGKGGTWALWGGVFWVLAIIFGVLGIIADAIDTALGLEPSTWLMLSIAFFVGSVASYLGWAVAVYLHNKG